MNAVAPSLSPAQDFCPLSQNLLETVYYRDRNERIRHGKFGVFLVFGFGLYFGKSLPWPLAFARFGEGRVLNGESQSVGIGPGQIGNHIKSRGRVSR